MTRLVVKPCVDSDTRAAALARQLNMPADQAATLGRSALEAVRAGVYVSATGRRVSLRAAVEAALAAKLSLPPEAELPEAEPRRFDEMSVEVANESTMLAGHRLVEGGGRALALNFANGVSPGGGFLVGARAQEEVLCQSSALQATLQGDPMYAAHRQRATEASSDWAILSPDVPFFREDDGTPLDAPWLLSIVTCAAPVAWRVGQPASARLLGARIHRVLAIAEAYRYEALVLGAWGCGAFGNDPARTAEAFRDALVGPFLGAYREVVFAIVDWSPARKFLGPFREAFESAGGAR